jgi:hypothetical protein
MGDAPLIVIPPPVFCAYPLVIVKPVKIAVDVSPFSNVTTVPLSFPSIIVEEIYDAVPVVK